MLNNIEETIKQKKILDNIIIPYWKIKESPKIYIKQINILEILKGKTINIDDITKY